ncbi:MAG TPA: uracil-DNA glycosylase [Thermoplasmata archaeon]|jgi:DNA polymerase|nr:uracil-DNA glycosylase [Thermoplasmata archaeon]
MEIARADLPRNLAALAVRIRVCTRCDLHLSRKRAVPGEGPPRARLLLVGEAPGRREDATGRPFQGAAGRILDDALRQAGIPRDRAFITNAVKCRPPENRRPRAGELAACRPYLEAQLLAARPRVIVTLGNTATRDLLGPGATLRTARGRRLSYGGIPVLATYHPAAVLYNRRLLPRLVQDLRKARERAEEG